MHLVLEVAHEFILELILIAIISAGVGLNVSNEKPTTCLNAVLQKLTPVASELQREDIMAAFFNNFESLYGVFMEQGE